MRRSPYLLVPILLALAPVTVAAQDARSVPLPTRQPDEPPMVRVWTSNASQAYRYGEPIRVTFEVDRDAFVMIGRVDAGGEVTILFPQKPNEQAAIFGRTRYYVDARPWASLSAWGASYSSLPVSAGYVFAIASDEPIDLTRFKSTRSNTWKTNLGFVMANYTLQRFDAERMIEAIADDVLFERSTLFGYDLEYFAVQGTRSLRGASCWGLFCPWYAGVWSSYCMVSAAYLTWPYLGCLNSAFLDPRFDGKRGPPTVIRPHGPPTPKTPSMRPPRVDSLRADTVRNVAPKADASEPKADAGKKVPTHIITMGDDIRASELDQLRRLGSGSGSDVEFFARRGVRREAPDAPGTGVIAANPGARGAAEPPVYRGTPPGGARRGELRAPDYLSARRAGRNDGEPKAVAAPRITTERLPRYDRRSGRSTGGGTISTAGGGARTDATRRGRTPGEMDRTGVRTGGGTRGGTGGGTIATDRGGSASGGPPRSATPSSGSGVRRPIAPSAPDRPASGARPGGSTSSKP